jgi:hypothetical protein
MKKILSMWRWIFVLFMVVQPAYAQIGGGVLDAAARSEALAAQASANSALSGSANDSTARGSASSALAGAFYGSTYVDETASRVCNGSHYTNSTGHVIFVFAVNTSSTNYTMAAGIGSASIGTVAYVDTTYGNRQVLSFLVPAGSDYWVTVSGNVTTCGSWVELR